MNEDQAGEKSFAPTAKRLNDAAQKGNVLRSREVATAVSMAAGTAWLAWAGPGLVRAIEAVARRAFRFDRQTLEDPGASPLLIDALLTVMAPILSLGLLVMLATTASQLAYGQGRFVPGNAAPKASRIDPVAGLGRMFGMQGLIELGKGLLKLALLGAIAFGWGASNMEPLLQMGRMELAAQLALAWDSAISLLFALVLGLAVIGLIDWPIQFQRWIAQLRMTHKEMRDEAKEAEGSPERRAAMRRRQRDLARGGVLKAMDKAQFVLTNPSHFALAMAYDPSLAPAPVVLAKGRGEKALAIRELALERDLPILEYPGLARSVYFTTRENQVVREDLYSALAALVAFVYSLKRGERPALPKVDAPVHLRFDASGRPVGL